MTKRILKGKVVSSKGNKTVVVEVNRKFQHPFYGKVISRKKKNIMHMMRIINLKRVILLRLSKVNLFLN